MLKGESPEKWNAFCKKCDRLIEVLNKKQIGYKFQHLCKGRESGTSYEVLGYCLDCVKVSEFGFVLDKHQKTLTNLRYYSYLNDKVSDVDIMVKFFGDCMKGI